MIRPLALIVALIAQAAFADSRSLSGSVVAMGPTVRPGAVAEITLQNYQVNDTGDEIAFALTHAGLTVSVMFDWDAVIGGADSITVTPPDGFLCVPADCVVTVPENDAGTLWLFDLDAVGM